MNKYTFKKCEGEGQCQCVKCGTVCWSCFFYEVEEFDNHCVCEDCKKHMENGTEDQIKIKWRGFKPKY